MLEAAAACGHAGHLLFGSRLPFYTPGSAIAVVVCAELSEDEHRAVAGEALQRILEEARP